MTGPSADDLDRLAALPGRLEAAAAALDRTRWLIAPAGTFCLVEQAWHLADLEREGYGVRIERLLHEEQPQLPDFQGDVVARERDYRAKALADGLAAFAAARAANVARLRAATPGDWVRGGTQDGVGLVTLADLPRMMREHDDGHWTEIEGLARGV